MVDEREPKREVFRPNINGSNEQKRLEAQKRKDLPNGLVFAKVNGITEMHSLDKVELHVSDKNVEFHGTVGDFIKLVLKDIMAKDIIIDKQTKAIISLDTRLKHIEKVVKNYGLE